MFNDVKLKADLIILEAKHNLNNKNIKGNEEYYGFRERKQ